MVKNLPADGRRSPGSFVGKARPFAAMAGADYGVFANGRWYMSKNIQQMLDWLEFKLQKQPSRKKRLASLRPGAQFAPEVMTLSPEHRNAFNLNSSAEGQPVCSQGTSGR